MDIGILAFPPRVWLTSKPHFDIGTSEWEYQKTQTAMHASDVTGLLKSGLVNAKGYRAVERYG